MFDTTLNTHQSTNSTPHPTTPQRSKFTMSQETEHRAHLWTCPLCSGRFLCGWKRHRHVKSCNAQLYQARLEQAEPLTEGTATEQGEAKAPGEDMDCEEDEDIRQSWQADATTDEEDSEGSTSLRSGGVGANQQQALCNVEDKCTPYNQYNARHCNITPKDMEILLFLQCNDLGVGCSREQKQGVLDYVKSFETARTKLLPKTIPTCYNRMDKVTLVHILSPCTPILCHALPSIQVLDMITVHIINFPINVVYNIH